MMADLRTTPPTATVIQAVFKEVLTQAARHNGDSVTYTSEEVKSMLGVSGDRHFALPLPPKINRQKFILIAMGANALDPAFLDPNSDLAKLWGRLVGRLGENVEVDRDMEIRLIDEAELPGKWRSLSAGSALAMLLIEGLREGINLDSRAIGYLLICLFTLTKSGNLTDNYVDKRLTMINRDFPALNLKGLVTRETIMEFNQLFPTMKVTEDDIYQILFAFNNVFKDASLGPLQWIIEQARASNMTAAAAIASMMADIKQNTFKGEREEKIFEYSQSAIKNALYEIRENHLALGKPVNSLGFLEAHYRTLLREKL
nr:unnamed protein product [Callosobruchus chinensis]